MRILNISSISSACLGRGDDVFHSYGSNQGFIISGDLGLIVDSGFYYNTARRILRRVLRHGAHHLMVVDTHYHSDHVFGNGVLTSKGAVVIAQENCRRSMMRFSRQLLAGYARGDPKLGRLLKGVEISYPRITYRDRLQIHLDDNLMAELIHPEGRAHTDGDSMVLVREDRVLFAGDVLWVGYHPNLEDADVQGQIRALRMILRLRPRKIVPGHGPVCGLGEVRRFIRYLEEFDENSRKGLKEGLIGDRLVRRVIPSWSWDWKMRWLMESYVKNLPRKNG